MEPGASGEHAAAAATAAAAKRELHADFSRVAIFTAQGAVVYANCKVLPADFQSVAGAFGERDAAVQRGLQLEGRRYEVHRHHPPLVWGRSVVDCEPELSTGIAACRVDRSRLGGSGGDVGGSSGGDGGCGSPAYIVATWEQPHTSAQAVPRLQEFVRRHLEASPAGAAD